MDFQIEYPTFNEWADTRDEGYVKYVSYLVYLFDSACKNGDFEKVEEVYEELKERHKYDVLTVEHTLCCIDLASCFRGALYSKSYELVKFFCKNGIFSLIPHDKKEEILVDMCYRSSIWMVREVLDVWDVDIDELSFENSTCLSNAAQNYDGSEIIELLIEEGAEPDMKDADGDTPLMTAAYLQHIGNIDALRKKGADPSLTNSDGYTYEHFCNV